MQDKTIHLVCRVCSLSYENADHACPFWFPCIENTFYAPGLEVECFRRVN